MSDVLLYLLRISHLARIDLPKCAGQAAGEGAVGSSGKRKEPPR